MSDDRRHRIRAFAKKLDARRNARQFAHPTRTMTGMRPVVVKVRRGQAFAQMDSIR